MQQASRSASISTARRPSNSRLKVALLAAWCDRVGRGAGRSAELNRLRAHISRQGYGFTCLDRALLITGSGLSCPEAGNPQTDMGKQQQPSSAWAVLLVLAASVVAGAAHEQTSTAISDEFSFLGASSNDSCAGVDCMQGSCVPNDDTLLSLVFPYTCKCNSGWTTLANLIPFLEIPSLPCNVPNCTLNMECGVQSPAPAPSSTPVISANSSGICGHGKCQVTSTEDSLLPTFKCACDPGYANVLNMTAGICVNRCEINGSCQNLGITLPGLLTSPPPPSPPSNPAENETANAGCRRESFDSGLYMAAALAMARWLLC